MTVDLAGAQGSGPGGRVVPADLPAIKANGTSRAPAPSTSTALKAPDPKSDPTSSTLLPPDVYPLSMMRKAIARHMAESVATSAHVTSTIEVDMTRVVRFRGQIKAEIFEGQSHNFVIRDFSTAAARRAVDVISDFILTGRPAA